MDDADRVEDGPRPAACDRLAQEIRRRRREAGLSQPELAARIGYTRQYVSLAERPKRGVPSRDLVVALDAALEANGELLVLREVAVQERGDVGRALVAPRGTSATEVRRPGGNTEVEGPAALRSTRRHGRADLTTVDQLATRVADIALRYETEPSASLPAEAGQCHAAVAFLLRQGASEPVVRTLHRTATTSATLLSQLMWDASGRRDGATALAYCADAVDHASACGDVVSAAHAELRKAYVALYGITDSRDPRAGLVAAQNAAHQSQAASHALHGLAHLHVGEAFAMLGEYRQCERALSAAETAFGRMSPDDVGAHLFSPSQFGRLAGSCYLYLGSPERAEPFLARTVGQLHDRPKTRSLVLGNLALSQLRQRRLDEATATLHQAIDLLEQSRGGGGMTVVFGAARELYPWRAEPTVQDIHDRLLGLMARA